MNVYNISINNALKLKNIYISDVNIAKNKTIHKLQMHCNKSTYI